MMRRSFLLCVYAGALLRVAPEARAVVPGEDKGARAPSSPSTVTPTTPAPRRAIPPARAAGAVRSTDRAGQAPHPTASAGATKEPEKGEVFVRDTFYGGAGDSLLVRSGETGATWTRHPKYPANVDNNWVLSREGRAYHESGGYRGALFLASGVPDGTEYDLRVTWHVETVSNDTDHGVVFRYDAATDTGYKLTYRTSTRRWELRLIKDGAPTDLASYPQTLSANTDYGVLVQVRTGWIRVKIDEVTRMTVRDTAIRAGGRVGIWGFGLPHSTPMSGIQVDKFLLASPGYAPPHYDLTGPSTVTPGLPSTGYTVALEKGANPGAVTITPTASGVSGAFSPGTVALTDAARSGTFTFTPAGLGTGTISVSDGGRLRDPAGASFTSAYGPPARLAHFESQIPWPCKDGPSRYTAGTGYWMDGTEHYDPILCFYNARDYCKRKGLPEADWSAAIAAAIVRYRDRYAIAIGEAGQGPAGHHVNATGLVRHWRETADPDDVRAIGYLISGGAASPARDHIRSFYALEGSTREVAFHLMAALDRESIGLGRHPLMEADVTLLLGHIAQWTAPPGSRYIRFCKPFMAGLNMRSLIAYWDRYRADPDPERAALVAAIPPAIRACCDFLWAECWYSAGTPVDMGNGYTWDHGAIKYIQPAAYDPSIAPLENLTIVSILDNHTFTGQSSLSNIDGYYKYARMAIVPTPGGYSAYVREYEGATRKFTIWPENGPLGLEPGGTFRLFLLGTDSGDGTGPVPDLNHMVAPAFAWVYWYRRRILGDAAGAIVYRARHDAIFDGGTMSWGPPTAQKQWNQALLWSTLGLDWRDRGDAVQVP